MAAGAFRCGPGPRAFAADRLLGVSAGRAHRPFVGGLAFLAGRSGASGTGRTVVLVGSGPFRVRDARTISRRRRTRLSDSEWAEYVALSRLLSRRGGRNRPAAMRRLGELSERADAYDPISHLRARGRMDPTALRTVGAEAAEMRRNGTLLRVVRRVRAPVLVVHGANDPHPIRGVVDPLRRAGLDLRVVPLERCGHEPWWERHARARFFSVLRRELRAAPRRPGPGRGGRAVRKRARSSSGASARVKSR